MPCIYSFINKICFPCFTNTIIDKINEKYGTHWQIFEPSAKVSVLRCVVPLKTMWLKDDKTYLATKRDIGKVAVSCHKTVDPKYSSWKVHVESTRNK